MDLIGQVLVPLGGLIVLYLIVSVVAYVLCPALRRRR